MEDIDAKIAQRFGQWLTNKLREKRMTMTRLAKLSGVSKQAISYYAKARPDARRGRSSLPGRKPVMNIAAALGVRTSEALHAAGYASDVDEQPLTLARSADSLDPLPAFEQAVLQVVDKHYAYIRYLLDRQGGENSFIDAEMRERLANQFKRHDQSLLLDQSPPVQPEQEALEARHDSASK